MRDFKDLRVWQNAHALTLAIYEATRNFPKEELFGLTSQLRRAAASIAANLAEGCGRKSDRELARHIQIARGSASELEYHLILALDLHLMKPETFERLRTQLFELQKMLTALAQTIRQDTASSPAHRAKTRGASASELS
jgi:four helix bundle protein